MFLFLLYISLYMSCLNASYDGRYTNKVLITVVEKANLETVNKVLKNDGLEYLRQVSILVN